MNRVRYYPLVILVILALGVFGVTLYRALYVSSDDSDLVPPASAQAVQSGTSTVPVRLKIPALSIDANVQQVGRTKAGAVGIPSNFTDVAWYQYSPVPGALGNALIDGHLDNAISLPGVFKHLSDIQPGDDIYVVNASGQELHFTVTKTESIPYNATSTDEIFSTSSAAHLILITCQGTWDQSIKEYSNRLVVFSTLSA